MVDGYRVWRYISLLEELEHQPDLVCGFDDACVDYAMDARGHVVWLEIRECSLSLTRGRQLWVREFGKVSQYCYLPERYIYRYGPGKADHIRFESHHRDQPRPHANSREGEHVYPEEGLDIIGLNLYIAIMICSEYASCGRYPLNRENFNHYNEIIGDAKRGLGYGECTMASDTVPAGRR